MSYPIDRVRRAIDHPVIDADGHTLEFWPALSSYVRDEGVALDVSNPLATLGVLPAWGRLTPDERMRTRAHRPAWWAFPARNTLDLGTALIPRLMYHRLDEMGIDLGIVYPSLGLVFLHLEEDELRRACCRAVNRYHAQVFAELTDRLIPVAVVPMQTPAEAISALDHAVLELGFKTILIGSYAKRPVDAAIERDPRVGEWAYWLDTFGLDSPFDYDPFWARCVELGVSVGAHSPTQGLGLRRSISSYVFNHIGNFACSAEGLCRSLFLGGVTQRFPKLRIGLLEGGVAWAATLLADLVGHWEKRNLAHIMHYDPGSIDRVLLGDLFRRYGARMLLGRATPIVGHGNELDSSAPGELDEFRKCRAEGIDDIIRGFVTNFSFGCEADDRFVPMAFDAKTNPNGARLSAMFGSDIGHWDVPDMSRVLVEAYESVENSRLTLDEFRAFTFENVARFYLETNRGFFDGTVLESAAARLA